MARIFDTEVAASLGVEDTFCLEARKGVSVEDFRPFVAVVAGGVACWATEKVAEVEDIALSLGLVFGVVVLKHVFNKGVEVFFGGVRPMDMQLKVHFSEGELADVGASLHVVASGDQLIEELFWNRLTRFVVAARYGRGFRVPSTSFP